MSASDKRSVAGATGRLVARSRTRELLELVVVAWVVRAVFIAGMPSRVHSADVDHWVVVAHQLREGLNPYSTTTFLNWPPLWLGCIWLIDHVARAAGISFFFVLRLFLIAAETGVIVTVYLFLSRFVPHQARRIVLVGICLNPVAILLVCQHGNFDVLVGLFVALGAFALALQTDAQDRILWITATAAFGVAALAKTVPLALAPLLASGAARVRMIDRIVGASLFVGPALVGVGALFALAPHAVFENVILYRSSPGYFGITGLLWGAGLVHVSAVYQKALFPAVGLLGVAFGCRALWRRRLDGPRIVLLAALIMLAIPSLGPGYAPQYAYWWLPVLVMTYPLFDERWRKTLIACYVVVGATYLVEYSLTSTQGAFLDALFTHASWIGNISAHLAHRGWQTVLRLPLFLASLLVLVAGVQRLRRPPLRRFSAPDTTITGAEPRVGD